MGAPGAATTCLILVLLASCSRQTAKHCRILLGSAQCDYHKLLYFRSMPEIKTNHDERILVFHQHFLKLKEKQKACLLRKILQFYKSVLKNIATTKVSKAEISTLRNDLEWIGGHCIQCRRCSKLLNTKVRLKEPYGKSLTLNGTAIISHQMQRLKSAQKKLKTNRAEIQEKVLFELAILWGFLDLANEEESPSTPHS